MTALRDPDDGCPWDREQTFETIGPYTLEEAYEVVDAIAREDMEHLKDELGDLLLQVVYHARMAEEANAFDFDDVVDGDLLEDDPASPSRLRHGACRGRQSPNTRLGDAQGGGAR